MEDPRPSLLAQLDLTKCRVELSNSPIVLLCGGPVPFSNDALPESLSHRIRKLFRFSKINRPQPQCQSLRHALTECITPFEFFRPEEITDWQIDSTYKNLMEFEKDLASICTLIVIILESAGAIAELGAFSQLLELKSRLIVFASNELEKNSFIELGILRYVAKKSPSRVKRYPWNPFTKTKFEQDFLNNVIRDVEIELNNSSKSQVLDSARGDHITVVICSLLEHFVALKENEIFTHLKALKMDIKNIRQLRGLLFLLEKFHLVTKHQYSDSTFYARSIETFHRLRLSGKEGIRIDPVRMKASCIEYYGVTETESHRQQAIKSIITGGRK